MNSLLFILLTILMFVDCIILIGLVLLQLPKKEAGAGLAFGAGASDALFGAGSGNVLTKITKWAGAAFFTLAIGMALVAAQEKKHTGAASLSDALSKTSTAAPAPIAAPAAVPASSSSSQPMTLLTNVPTSPAAAPAATTTPAAGTNK